MNSLAIGVPHLRFFEGGGFDFYSIILSWHVFFLETRSVTAGQGELVRARMKESNARSSGLPSLRWD
jgi:hypothetical protein